MVETIQKELGTFYYSNEKISTKPEEILYLLTFEGKNEMIYEGNLEHDGPNKFPIIDSQGTRFFPEFAGTAKEDGIVSNKEWSVNGSVDTRSGKYVFTGKVTLPEPKLTLIYLVPKKASGLVLKDGDQRYPIK